jgi:hypothetical protein
MLKDDLQPSFRVQAGVQFSHWGGWMLGSAAVQLSSVHLHKRL